MRTRIVFKGLRPMLEYKITYTVKRKRRGLFGIPYTAKEKRVKWVPSKVYFKLKNQAIGTTESAIMRNLFRG